MSEQHRGGGGAWGQRDDAVWWAGALGSGEAAQSAQQQQQQQLLNQHLQQQQLQAQHDAALAVAQQLQQAQQEAVARSTAAAAQHLFSYKMASSFQNAVTSLSPSVCSNSNYDYGRTDSNSHVQQVQQQQSHQQQVHQQHQQQAPQQQAQQQQWWYPGGMQNPLPHMQNMSSVAAQQLMNRGRMPRKADSKPRGRMTAYAFFVQTCREEHKKQHPDENVVFAEFSKKCAERWKTMLDKEKKRFHEMAEKDKNRYDSEMQDYVPPAGEKRGKKRKHNKDPNAPKRPLEIEENGGGMQGEESAGEIQGEENAGEIQGKRGEIEESDEESDDENEGEHGESDRDRPNSLLSAFFWFCNDERGKVKSLNPEFGVGEIAKELGRRWSDISPDLKNKYEQMAEKDKARYERDMTAYKKKPKGGMPAPVQDKDEDDEEEEEEDDEGDDDD